jgi:hypothetical protein
MKPDASRPISRIVRNAALMAAIAATASGLAIAAKPGGGSTTPWNVRLHGAGDSIMRGYNASCTGNTGFLDLLCYSGGDQPENSFFDGTSTAVKSLADYFIAAGAKATYSKAASQSGTELVGGTNNFAAQAITIVNAAGGRSAAPVQVKVELGGNDICHQATTATLYLDDAWRAGVQAGLEVLTNGLPAGSSVVLVGVPRVQDLYDVGVAKSSGSSRVNCPSFWDSYDVCEIATVNRVIGGQDLRTRLGIIAERQASYNRILKEQADHYKALSGTTRVEVVAETDGVYGNRTPEVGNYSFTTSEINGGDCFHPSIAGQNKISTVVWGNDPYRVRPQ